MQAVCRRVAPVVFAASSWGIGGVVRGRLGRQDAWEFSIKGRAPRTRAEIV